MMFSLSYKSSNADVYFTVLMIIGFYLGTLMTLSPLILFSPSSSCGPFQENKTFAEPFMNFVESFWRFDKFWSIISSKTFLYSVILIFTSIFYFLYGKVLISLLNITKLFCSKILRIKWANKSQGCAFGQNFFGCPTEGRAEKKNQWLARPKAEPSRVARIARSASNARIGSAPSTFSGNLLAEYLTWPSDPGVVFDIKKGSNSAFFNIIIFLLQFDRNKNFEWFLAFILIYI